MVTVALRRAAEEVLSRPLGKQVPAVLLEERVRAQPITNDENDPRYHPGKSMDATARYLLDLFKEHGNWQKAVLHYGENTPAYLNRVKRAAVQEADEYEHFHQGKFLPPPSADNPLGQHPFAQGHAYRSPY